MLKTKTIVIVCLLFASSVVFAKHHGKGMKHHMYDTKTEVTAAGVIENTITESHTCCGTTVSHLYIMLKTADESIKVFLGPSDFVNPLISLKKGDQVTVFGSRTTMKKESVIIAKNIKKQGQEAVLRNDDGSPKWPGKMRHKAK